MTLLEVAPTTSPVRPAGHGFRSDLEGLRGLAVLLVVAFHADMPLFAGGFIGVDVFFVLSGWLITRQLLGEAESSGSIALREFWARRVRRLVPALALVVLVTMVASVVLLNPLELARTARDGMAAVTYSSNVVFANDASGYFAPQSESLFLHTWSLAVEEQFYLVWPLGLLGLAALTRRRATLLRPLAGVAFLVVGALSFALAVVQTDRGTPWSFYGLPTRAWEFAAAGAVAAGGALWARGRGFAGLAGLGWLGVGAILWAGWSFDETTPYPALPTVVPVLGTLALIVWGEGRLGPGAALSLRPLRWLGRVSYAWYLWHWPVILLAVERSRTDSTVVRSAGALVALGLAAGTHRWLENPVRFSRSLRAVRWRTYAVGGAASVVVLVAALGLRSYSDRALDDPLIQRLHVAREEVDDRLPCEAATTPKGDAYCLFGDLGAERTVLLLGDSHAEQWIPGLAAAADGMPVRLAVFARGGCPPVDVVVAASDRQRVPSAGCVDHRAAVGRVLDLEQPDLVVIGVTDFVGRILEPDGDRPDDDTQRRMFVDGLEALVQDVQATGTGVAFILDNPRYAEDPVTCVARSRSVESCRSEPEEVVGPVSWLIEAEREISREHGLPPPFDVVSELCDAQTCQLDNGETFFYGDATHLSPRYTASQADALAAWLAAALGSTRN